MSSTRASAVPVCAAALIVAAVLGGCASSRLSSQPPPGVRLAGDWKLDAARSDDLGKAVGELRAQLAKAHHDTGGGQQQSYGSHTGRRRGGGDSGGQQPGEAGPSESSAESGTGEQGVETGPTPHGSPVDELMSSVPRGDYLRITASSGAFTVISGDSSAEYTPGLESEISTQQGDAEQTSGWKAADYVIDTKPQWGPEIIQSYGLTKEGNLSVTVRLTGGGTNFTFTRVYDRTTRVAPLAPPTIN